jgi:hypothetical protein
VAILDCNAERLTDEQAIHRIQDANPRLVCFVLYGQNPNSGTTNMIGGTRLCAKLKQAYPEYPTCFVGSHVSALPKEVLSYDFIDIVLLNEGVYALHNLLCSDLSTELGKVKGIGHKQGGKLILNPPQHIVPQHLMDQDLPGYAWDFCCPMIKSRSICTARISGTPSSITLCARRSLRFTHHSTAPSSAIFV